VLTDPRITARELGIELQELPQLRHLEEQLAAFIADLERDPVDESDEDHAARAYVRLLAEAGLLRWVVPGAHGGAAPQLRSVALCVIRQWLARSSGALDTAFVMQGLGGNPIAVAGSPELQARLLPKIARGETICAFALTEPGAGSDLQSIATLATPRPDGGVTLRGEKCFISNAGVADSIVVFAREAPRPGEDSGARPRFGAFWLPGDAPGLSVVRTKVIAPHPIGRLLFDDVVVPAGHRLGAPGDGLKLALGNLDVFRVSVGAAALGLADRALSESIAHLQRRVQFGRPLAEQQGLLFQLADVATDHLASQLLVYRAAAARDAGRAEPDQPAMAKLHATESAQRTIDRAVQIFGGLGVTVGQVPERLYREIRALRIYEGTSEVQKLIIARRLLRG
jgi:acyl-CoA dehydrogenase